MKVVICGDTHIGAVFGLGRQKAGGGNSRIDDYENTLNYIVDHCINNHVDLFIQTGDAFELRDPSPEHMSIFNNALRRLSGAGITSCVIMGNHDYRRSGNTFTSAISLLAAKFYPNIKISLNPEILEIKKNGENLQVILLPYRDRKMYDGETTEEDSVLYDNEVRELVSSCNKNDTIIAVGHNFFYEGSYGHFNGLEILTKIDAFNGCDMVVMGHYHDFRILQKTKPIAIYSGSMERGNFGDAGVNKYFIEFETKKKKIKMVKTPVKDLFDGNIDLSMYDTEHFWKMLKEEFLKIDFKDKIVRFNIATQERIISDIKKNDIRDLIYEQGAFYVSKITLEPIFKKLVRDNKVLEYKDDLSRALAFIDSQSYDDELKSKLIEEIKIIIGTNDSSISKT